LAQFYSVIKLFIYNDLNRDRFDKNSMKFIHTSDWHLGRQFHHQSLLEDQAKVLEQLLQYIEQEAVDAVIIAGDIYDRAVPPAAAVKLLDDTLAKICLDLKVPVIIIPGNHDSADRLSFGSRHLRTANLHIISELSQITDAIAIKSQDCTVHIFGIPYNDPENVRNHFNIEVKTHDQAHRHLVAQILAVKPDAPTVLVSHCFMEGAESSESERPLSIGGAECISSDPFAPFDYVALGHLHRPQHKEQEQIRYSGSLMKYSFSEHNQKKAVTLVEINANGLQSIQQLPLQSPKDLRIIEGEFQSILERGKTDPKADDYLLIRLTDKHAILEPMERLRTVYQNVLHVEKIGIFNTTETRLQPDKFAKHSEFKMFQDFFRQVQGEELNTAQAEVVQQAIAAIHRKDN
jgi:exonuclease SbcD